MKVRLTTARVTQLTRDNRGDVIDVSDGEAAALIKTHQAVLAPDDPVTRFVNVQTTVETNMLQPVTETAGGRTKIKRR